MTSTTDSRLSTTSTGTSIPPLPAWAKGIYDDELANLLWQRRNSEEGYEAAVAYFRSMIIPTDTIYVGAPYPQDTQDPPVPLSFDNITVYYHRTYPLHAQARYIFTWTFYVGRDSGAVTGRKYDDIVPGTDLGKHGIYVEMQDGTRWEPFTFFVVRPRTLIRVRYTFQGEDHTHELLFPPNPDQPLVAFDVLPLPV
ncbi:hypothetical protein DL96DRAFT_1586747 [Flagelloscypha sp. PMI_526]|nr:hypothetical protein DL96DRAFT_1586747 [Flagelloscypha sp. PMI_526]